MNHSDESLSGDGSRRSNKPRHGPIEWILVGGNRLTVAAALLLVVFGLLGGLAVLGITAINSPAPLFYLFSAFIGGNITLITVVLSINQLVLARQLKTPGSLRTEFRSTEEFRQHAADAVDQSVMPTLPPAFLYKLVDATQQQTRTVSDSASMSDPANDTDLHDVITVLRDDLDEISALLEQSTGGPFHALSAILNTHIGKRIQQVQQIQGRDGTALSEETREALDGLLTQLELIDVSREYFKTLFMQKELSYLSRVLLYVGVPAELTATVMLLTLAVAPETAPSWLSAAPAVPAIVTVTFAPLVVLSSFVLRIAVVTERTVTIAPFTTPEQIR